MGLIRESPLQFSSIAKARKQVSNKVSSFDATSTQDSALLDVLVPLFEKQSGYAVKAISIGTGQALTLGPEAVHIITDEKDR